MNPCQCLYERPLRLWEYVTFYKKFVVCGNPVLYHLNMGPILSPIPKEGMAMITKISLTAAAVALVAFLAAPSESLAATKKQAATKNQDAVTKNQDTDFREEHQKAVSHYRSTHKKHKSQSK